MILGIFSALSYSNNASKELQLPHHGTTCLESQVSASVSEGGKEWEGGSGMEWEGVEEWKDLFFLIITIASNSSKLK